MSETVVNLLGTLVMFAIYGSSLLFWPVHHLLYRRQTRRGRALLRMFLAQVLLYGAWCLVAWRVGNWVEGFFLVLPLNMLFCGVGLVIWVGADNAKVPANGNKTG